MYNELYFMLGALVSLLYIVALVVIIVTFQAQSKPASPTANPRQALSPLAELRDNASRLLAEVGVDLEQLHLDLEDYKAKSWNRETESEERYFRLVGNLFLLIDHLENALKDEKKTEEIGWIYGKTNQILESEGIERMLVKKGDRFSGTYHKYVAGRPDKLPKGTILEVTRRGYHAKDETGEDRVFRPAEVIVSSGQSENR